MTTKREFRVFKSELRVVANPVNPMAQGYAAVFNTETDLGCFRETIAPGAFTRAIAEQQDVRMLFNHNPDNVLGRTKSGTLRLSEDGTGLRCENDMPDTQLGRDVYALMKRGDISQMSFGFSVRDEEVLYNADGTCLRIIKDVDLYDVSPVTYPAYESTSVEARSVEEVRAALESKREAGKGACMCGCPECTAGNCDACSNDACADENCRCMREESLDLEVAKLRAHLIEIQ